MNINQKSIFGYLGIAILGLSITALASGFGPPSGKGKGKGGKGGKDNTPPAAVTNLTVFAMTHRSIGVMWTATGDDGIEGVATEYDLRYSFDPITESNWDSATRAAAPTPGLSGTVEMGEVGSLFPDLVYFIAIRVVDDNDNISSISEGSVVFTSTDSAPVTPWSISPVLEAGQCSSPHLTFNPLTDSPSIAFHFFDRAIGEGTLKLATLTEDGSWFIEPVVADDSGHYSHVYDPDGVPYISFGGRTKFLSSINLAWHDGVQWQTEFVDEVGGSDAHDLAIDPNGDPSMVYWRKSEPNGPRHAINELVLATRVDGVWSSEVVAPDTIPRNVAMEYHPLTELPVIAYGDDSGGTPTTLAWFNGEVWQFELIPLDQSRNISLAIDPISGEASVTSQPLSSLPAELCTLTIASGWFCDVYSLAWPSGRNSSLLITTDSTPMIAHRTRTSSTYPKWIYLVSRFDQVTNTWIQEEADVTGYTGGFRPSLGMTAAGQVFMAFAREVENSDEPHLYIAERSGN